MEIIQKTRPSCGQWTIVWITNILLIYFFILTFRILRLSSLCFLVLYEKQEKTKWVPTIIKTSWKKGYAVRRPECYRSYMQIKFVFLMNENNLEN